VPTYEYRCAAGHQYEKREGFDAPSVQKCEKCSRQARRVLFAPPVVFKGSGFYKTDNRSSSSNGGGSETASTSSTSSSDHGHSHGPDGHSHGDSSSDSVESAAAT
jgi:putative FmdB family regulatory protein